MCHTCNAILLDLIVCTCVCVCVCVLFSACACVFMYMFSQNPFSRHTLSILFGAGTTEDTGSTPKNLHGWSPSCSVLQNLSSEQRISLNQPFLSGVGGSELKLGTPESRPERRRKDSSIPGPDSFGVSICSPLAVIRDVH